MIYKPILKPEWVYGIQIWGCAKQHHIITIQRFQNKVLRNIVNAPWYCRNKDIHRDLGVEDVAKEIQRVAGKHETRLHNHANVEVIPKPFELV